jgi:hypothetical protein
MLQSNTVIEYLSYWQLHNGLAIFRMLLLLQWDSSRICQTLVGFTRKHVLMMNLLEEYSLNKAQNS